MHSAPPKGGVHAAFDIALAFALKAWCYLKRGKRAEKGRKRTGPHPWRLVEGANALRWRLGAVGLLELG